MFAEVRWFGFPENKYKTCQKCYERCNKDFNFCKIDQTNKKSDKCGRQAIRVQQILSKNKKSQEKKKYSIGYFMRIWADKIIISNADILGKCKYNQKAQACNRGNEIAEGGFKQVINNKTKQYNQTDVKINQCGKSCAEDLK